MDGVSVPRNIPKFIHHLLLLQDNTRGNQENQMQFQVGDWVVYRKTKHSTTPGPRAMQVKPSAGGEEYAYQVDKFWVVAEVRDELLVLETRRGKQHEVSPNDPNLRRPNLWERWWHRARFQSPAVA